MREKLTGKEVEERREGLVKELKAKGKEKVERRGIKKETNWERSAARGKR